MDTNSVSINQRVENIKDDKTEINRLIEEYKPFIASVVESSIGRYVRYGEDDELSIGLMAFEESIRTYDSLKGNYLAFARNVIKRRLIDYYRKEKKHSHLVPLIEKTNEFNDEEEFDNSEIESIKIYARQEESKDRIAEIEQLKKELSNWGLTYFDVAQSSPKQEGTRKIYRSMVEAIVNNVSILDIIKKKKYLPINEIEKISKIPRKKIERARNYIIAAVLIITGEYEYLKDFLDWR
jgi:RNA polymerase sigma factor